MPNIYKFCKTDYCIGLERQPERRYPLPPVIQLTVFLRYTASSSFQQAMDDCLDCAAGTVCKYLRSIAYRLASIRNQLVNYDPTPETLKDFEDNMGFRTVVGAIDSFHVPVTV